MGIKDTITGLTSKVGPWGWAAGGVLLIGLVFLLTKGSGSTSSTAMPAADINDWLNQLQTAVDSLVDSKNNPPSESADGDHPDIPGSKPGIEIIDGKKVIGIGGLNLTWIDGKYVPGVGGTAYGDMTNTREWSKPGIIRRGTTSLSGDDGRVKVEARNVSTALLGSSRNAVVSR